jgi:hypothetical protein
VGHQRGARAQCRGRQPAGGSSDLVERDRTQRLLIDACEGAQVGGDAREVIFSQVFTTSANATSRLIAGLLISWATPLARCPTAASLPAWTS